MKKFFLSLALLNIISLSSFANNEAVAKDSSNYYADVKVLAEKNEYVYLKVAYQPQKQARLVVTDGLGETLYSAFVEAGNFQKIIKFSLEELPGGIEILFIEKGEIIKQINVNIGFSRTYALVETTNTN